MENWCARSQSRTGFRTWPRAWPGTWPNDGTHASIMLTTLNLPRRERVHGRDLPWAWPCSKLPGASRRVGSASVWGAGLVSQQVRGLLASGTVVGAAHTTVKLLAVGEQGCQAQQWREGHRWIPVLLVSWLRLSLLILLRLHAYCNVLKFSWRWCSVAGVAIAREVGGAYGADRGSRVWAEPRR